MESVGELLRRTREAQGKTIEEVAKATRMSRVVHEYLEDERLSPLTPPVYVKGPHRTNPSNHGLDEEQVVQKYLHFTQQQEPDELDEWDAVEVEIHDRRKLAGRRWTWIVAAAAILAAVIIYTTRKGRPLPPAHPVGMTFAIPPVGQERPEPVRVERGTGSVADDSMIVWHKLSLVAVARERTWISVTIDGEPSGEVTLEVGQRGEWEAEEMFELDVGSGGTVDLYLNGEPLGTPGSGRRLVEGVVINETGIVH